MNHRPNSFSFMPEVVKNLLIINALLYFASHVVKTSLGVDFWDLLGLHLWFAEAFNPIQLLTHMFMHSEQSMWHIAMNMFVLWMFGITLENLMGSKRFLQYYLITGLGAAFLHYVIVYFQIQPDLALFNAFINDPSVGNLAMIRDNHVFYPPRDFDLMMAFKEFKENVALFVGNPSNTEALNQIREFIPQYKEHYLNAHNIVGASGAVYGLLMAFAYLFPNEKLYLYFVVPVKAKYVVIGFVVFELFMGVSNSPDDNVAHFAHLGGMLFGYFLLKYWGYRPRG